MSQHRLFRWLLVSDIVLTTLSVPLSFLGERFLPPALQAYAIAQADAPLSLQESIFLVVALPMLVAQVVAWIGLLKWQAWAPHLYLGVSVGIVLTLPIAGPTVETGFDTAANTAGCILSGLILGMAYFSDLRARFRGGSVPEPPRVASAASSPGRYDPPQSVRPTRSPFRVALDGLFAFDRLADLVGLLFVVAMLLYGAIVVPRLRFILGTAVITAGPTWWVWRAITGWLRTG